MRDPGFQNERELTDCIERMLVDVLDRAGTWISFREHQVETRIADLMVVEIDADALKRRIQGGWIRPLTAPELRVMRHLRIDRGMSLDTLASRLSVGVRAAERTLRTLTNDGFVDRTAAGSFARSMPLDRIALQSLAIEAKLRDWRGALHQANAFQTFADQSYVAFDARYSDLFEREYSRFAELHIGLIAVDSTAAIELLPGARTALFNPFAAALNNELVLGRLLGAPLTPLPETRLPSASLLTEGRGSLQIVGHRSRTLRRLTAAFQ